ncbi:MAG: hypothetical protein PVJ52_02115 [Candidatus Woesebacteria bacterium]|jgi:hypothetical protein
MEKGNEKSKIELLMMFLRSVDSEKDSLKKEGKIDEKRLGTRISTY